ncbi:MAG: acyltransferase [Erysipelotrichaceae bacterium]|nr:acyltransferase [Erysipelotrichaceae bacterium]
MFDRQTDRQTDRQIFIYYLRAFSVLCILACHLCSAHTSSYVQMLSQFFNIGVEIFFIISAFCFGLQGSIKSVKEWYKKRFKRIFLPYECFLIILAIAYIVIQKQFKVFYWITCIFGVQGANVGVLGAEQTWFITALIICYICTPLLSNIWDSLNNKQNRIYAVMVLLVIPFVLVLFPPVSIYTIGHQVCFYGIAYFLGRTYKDNLFNEVPRFIYLMTMFLSFGVRIIGRFMFDGSRLYECIIVGYTQYASALCIFILISLYLNNKEPGKIINWLCNISFEVYLYHYMFIVGPISLMNVTNSWIFNSVMVLCITFVIATIMNQIINITYKKLLISNNQ